MAKRILVPLDQSGEAEVVLELVADLARSSGATVRLLHVAPSPRNLVDEEHRVLAYADQEAARLGVEALDYLRAVEVHLGGVPVECAVRFGDPLREILLDADAFGADLIAVTARPRRPLGRVFRRGLARRLFGRARAAVMVFRPDLEEVA